MASPLEALQSLGRALMLPIAVLPAAGLLLRLGQPDLLDVAFIAAAGVVCFLIASRSAEVLLHVPPEAVKGMVGDTINLASAAFKEKAIAKVSVPIGIISGLVGGQFYNRFSNIKLPEYLAFFGGRRFVPIVAGLAGLALGAFVGFTYEGLDSGMDGASRAIVGSGEAGLFIYGVLNRALIVTGLHHILNNIAWFIVGDFNGATGDLNRFFAGDPSAGSFMAGFFPVMMFGLPAACLAMYHAAPAHRRKAVGGMLASMALTTFLTGVTEPIEFSFMFLAPVLYAIHAALTGLSFIIMSLLGVKLGFGFSAGFFDYAQNFGKATRPLLLLPIGLAYFALYYGVFRWAIARFDLKTPGREAEAAPDPARAKPTAGKRGEDFLTALGGGANLVSVDACTTRLRLVIKDQAAVDEAGLRALGSRGMVRPSEKALQVVLGPLADQVAGEIRQALAGGQGTPSVQAAVVAEAAAAFDMAPWAAALGGRKNVLEAVVRAGRLCLRLADPAALDEAALAAKGVRGVARLPDGAVQLLLPRT